MGAELISRDAHRDAAQAEAGLTLLFPAGSRPSADQVAQALLAADAPHHPNTSAQAGRQASRKPLAATISSQRGVAEGWLELLASGLTFDLTGLAPGAGLAIPPARHFFGLPRDSGRFSFEAIAVFPGPHLAGAGAMVPVVRVMAALASALAQRLGALAVCWEPAGSWMDVQYFSRIVEGWGAGGAFPALGLTGIERTADGGVESDGLAYFIGQELRLEARSGEAAADTVKLAARVIDHLVNTGRVTGPDALVGPDGEALVVEPAANGSHVQVWRDG